jgi:hypothetical protein
MSLVMKGTQPSFKIAPKEAGWELFWPTNFPLKKREDPICMQITTIGIDLAKKIFQLHGINERGKVVLSRKVTRAKLREVITKLPCCLNGMEACSSSHYWAREFEKIGHTVRLMSPQFVKPYVKTNKNGMRDAEAI